MIISILLSHGWKKISRSISFDKEVTTAIFLGLISLMIVGYSLALGFALNGIITKSLQQADSISFLNGILIYYFCFEFLMRYFMQGLPVLDVQPYLHLPIRRSVMVHYLLAKSLVHIMNSFVLLLFTPFALTVITQKYGAFVGWSWLLTLWLLSIAMHYVVILFKKKLDDTTWGVLALVAIISLFSAADYYGWFKLSSISLAVFSWALVGYYLFLAIFTLTLILYWVNFQFFLSALYPEELSLKRDSTLPGHQDIAFLKNFGSIGEWINLEVKLILRNKRPRTILFLSALFLLYGLIFYTKEIYLEEQSWILFFVGIFTTGIFTINYGQFLFSWQGSHFDFIVTRPVSVREFIESKYWLLSTVIMVCFLLSIPYVYFGWKILFINAAMALYNVGVNTIVIMNMAMWKPKKIDLKKGATFNYEGVGAAQWLMGFPLMVGPYLFYLPFGMAGYRTMGLLSIALMGVIGIVLRPYLLNLTANRLLKLKYSIAAGFRKE